MPQYTTEVGPVRKAVDWLGELIGINYDSDYNQKSYPPPKPSLIRKLKGDALSDTSKKNWPQLANAWAAQEIEMPDETQAVGNLRPMNFLEQLLPDAQGITYPWGTIALNRDNIEKEKADLRSVLRHELTHIGQTGTPKSLLRGLYGQLTNTYENRPNEIEAFKRMYLKKIPKDIDLDRAESNARIRKNMEERYGKDEVMKFLGDLP